MTRQIVGLVLILATSVTTAEGAIVTYQFTGTLFQASDTDNLLGYSYSVGDTFSGFFSYDSDLPDSSPNPDYFTASSPTITSFVKFDGHEFTGSSNRSVSINGSINTMRLLNGFTSDPFVDLGDSAGRLISISLIERNSSFNNMLPPSLDLADFSQGAVQVHGDSGPDSPRFGLHGTIDTLTRVDPVPEPASLAVWSLLGFVGFLTARRRRRR